MLASNYGWAKKDILEGVYLDELFVFMRLIKRRQVNDAKLALAIATNPHTKDPKRLWEQLDREARMASGKDYLDAEFDQAGMEMFKRTVQRHSRGVVVK